jgi:hypothetical protein
MRERLFRLKKSNRKEVDGWRDGLEYVHGGSMEVASFCSVNNVEFPVDLAFRYTGKSKDLELDDIFPRGQYIYDSDGRDLPKIRKLAAVVACSFDGFDQDRISQELSRLIVRFSDLAQRSITDQPVNPEIIHWYSLFGDRDTVVVLVYSGADPILVKRIFSELLSKNSENTGFNQQVILVSVLKGGLSNWKFILKNENFEDQVRQLKRERVKLKKAVNKLKRTHDKVVEQQEQLSRESSELMTAIRRVKNDITSWRDTLHAQIEGRTYENSQPVIGEPW